MPVEVPPAKPKATVLLTLDQCPCPRCSAWLGNNSLEGRTATKAFNCILHKWTSTQRGSSECKSARSRSVQGGGSLSDTDAGCHPTHLVHFNQHRRFTAGHRHTVWISCACIGNADQRARIGAFRQPPNGQHCGLRRWMFKETYAVMLHPGSAYVMLDQAAHRATIQHLQLHAVLRAPR